MTLKLWRMYFKKE